MKDIEKAIAELKSLYVDNRDHDNAIKAGVQALEVCNDILDSWDFMCNMDDPPIMIQQRLEAMSIDAVRKLCGDYFAYQLDLDYKKEELEKENGSDTEERIN